MRSNIKYSAVIFILLLFIFPQLHSSKANNMYNFRFFIQGNASGKIFFVIPFRIFYQASASMNFMAEPAENGLKFQSVGIDNTGYMMRTLGFGGKSLAILVAGKNPAKMKKFADKMEKNFKYIAPGFMKHIEKILKNFFLVKSNTTPMRFYRNRNGIQQISPGFKIDLVRTEPASDYLKINFNIYKILRGVIKIFNHSYTKNKSGPEELLKKDTDSWLSDYIDYTSTLVNSSRRAAKIFEKVKDLKQYSSFKAKFSSHRNEEGDIIIHGHALPNVSIWKEIRITDFDRLIKLKSKTFVVISDRIKIKVQDKFGNGGIFIAELQKRRGHQDNIKMQSRE